MHKFSAVITAFLLAFGLFSFSNVLNVSAINDDNEQIVEDITGNTENEMDNNSDNTESDVSKFEDEEEHTGTINIFLDEMSEGEAINVEGVIFSLIKVAELEDGEYILREDFENTNVNLNNLNTAEEANEVLAKIMNKVEEENIQGREGTTNKYGTLTFDSLDMGVYYIYATDTNEYDYVMPSIVAIPTHDESSDSVNGMMFEIEIVPKHSPKEEELMASIESVKTGDEANIMFFGLAGAGAMLVFFKAREKA